MVINVIQYSKQKMTRSQNTPCPQKRTAPNEQKKKCPKKGRHQKRKEEKVCKNLVNSYVNTR